MLETNDKSEENQKLREEDDLPQHILEKYDSSLQVQLIKGYRILQVLLYHSENNLFFEKPENDILGTKSYYNVIKQPIWLYEIKRRFFNAEYNSLTEAIRDMRLLFENCYYFWGPKASISQQCLLMERQLEYQILLLPRDLKRLCTPQKTHGNDDFVERLWNRCKNKVKNCSNLMLRAWRKRRLHEGGFHAAKSDLSAVCKNSNQISVWEKETLLLKDNSLFSMPELPEMGLFLMLVQNVLDLESLSQIEIERMFLAPYCSQLFRKLLEIFLDIDRADELISYDTMITTLMQHINEWYQKFSKTKLEDLQSIGIDDEFFEALGQKNPFDNQKFDDISYYQKVIIFRTLCDYFIQRRSDVKKLVLDALVQKVLVRRVGQDKCGFTYLYCSMFSDFRLYKSKFKEVEKRSEEESKIDLNTHKSLMRRLFCENVVDCEVVADSLEEMRSIIDELFYSDLKSPKKEGKASNSVLIQKLLDLEAELHSREVEFINIKNQFRIKFFNEWKEATGSYGPIVDKADNIVDEKDVAENNGDDENNSIGSSNREYAEDLHDEENSLESTNKECIEKDIHVKIFQIEENSNREFAEEDSHNKEDKEITKKADESSGENENKRGRKKKKRKKRKKKRKKHKYEDSNENLEKEWSSGKPAVADLVVNTEISDEDRKQSKSEEKERGRRKLTSDKYTDGDKIISRRRRSSVPLYNFARTFFDDDEDEFISEDEVLSSDDDSDDDWEIPQKRSKTKKNSKTFRGGWRGRSRNTTEFVECEIKEEPVESTSCMTEEVIIKEEIKTEKTENTEEEETLIKAEKPSHKIKVVDFAKLNNNDNISNLGIQTLRPNSFMMQISNASNSLPVIRSIQSNAPFSVNSRPLVANTAFVISSARQPRQFRNPFSQRFTSVSNNEIPQLPRIVRAQSINPAYTNTLRPRMPPLIRATSYRAIRPMSTDMMRSRINPYENITQLSKISRNVTVIPKPVQRRPLVREIEGTIGAHSNNGRLEYVVNLANGSHVSLSNEQVQKLRDGNNGVLPHKLKIPVPTDVAEKIEPCVVIDD